MTIINVVYLAFTVIQFIYLYSYIFSDAHLNATLNLAQYARQGFFQLMVINQFCNHIINKWESKERRDKK